MTLPKLETKTYTLTLPSTGEEIKYRPFLVKEQKTLLMAQESKEDNQIVDAMSQLIDDCTFGKVNTNITGPFDKIPRPRATPKSKQPLINRRLLSELSALIAR